MMGYMGSAGTLTIVSTSIGALVGALVGVAFAALAAMRFLRREVVNVVRQEERKTQAAVAQLTKAVEAGSQAWYWTADWQAVEAEADEDISAGRVTRTDSVEALERELDAVVEVSDDARHQPVGSGMPSV
jgi:hypothetical protein